MTPVRLTHGQGNIKG